MYVRWIKQAGSLKPRNLSAMGISFIILAAGFGGVEEPEKWIYESKSISSSQFAVRQMQSKGSALRTGLKPVRDVAC